MRTNFKKFQKVPLIVSLVFLLASISIFTFLYVDMKKKRSTAEAEEIAWLAEADRRSELQSLNRSLKALEEDRAVFDKHFIKGTDVVPFLSMIDTLAPEAGAKVEVSLVDLLKENAGLVVEMRIGGKFEQLYKFLQLLENSPYELEFLSIDMQKADLADQNGKMIVGAWLGVFKVKVLSIVP